MDNAILDTQKSALQERIDSDIQKYNITNQKLAEIKEKCKDLTITGIDDREGYLQVYEAFKFVKSHRIEVEKTRKDLKAGSLEYGRAIDSEAKRITLSLSPIENRLKNMLNEIDTLKAEIKAAKERKIRERLQSRVNKLLTIGMEFDGSGYSFQDNYLSTENVGLLTDDMFQAFLGTVSAEIELHNKKLEEQRLAQEAAERAEQERLEAIRLAEEKKRQEEAERLAEQQRIEAERLAAEQERLNEEKEKLEFI